MGLSIHPTFLKWSNLNEKKILLLKKLGKKIMQSYKLLYSPRNVIYMSKVSLIVSTQSWPHPFQKAIYRE